MKTPLDYGSKARNTQLYKKFVYVTHTIGDLHKGTIKIPGRLDKTMSNKNYFLRRYICQHIFSVLKEDSLLQNPTCRNVNIKLTFPQVRFCNTWEWLNH